MRVARFVIFFLFAAGLLCSGLLIADNLQILRLHREIREAAATDTGLLVHESGQSLFLAVSRAGEASGEAVGPGAAAESRLDQLDWRTQKDLRSQDAPQLLVVLVAAALLGLAGAGFLGLSLAGRAWGTLLVAAVVMACGLFSLANNLFLSGYWSKAALRERREARSIFREAYVQRFGRLPRSGSPEAWEADAADQLLAEDPDLQALVKELPSLRGLEPELALRTLLARSDAAMLEELQALHGIAFRVIPRPSNSLPGMNQAQRSILARDIGGLPSRDQLQPMLATLSREPASRTLSPLARLLVAELEELSNDPTSTAVARANGAIQLCTLIAFLLGVWLIGFRWLDKVKRPLRQLDETLDDLQLTGDGQERVLDPIAVTVRWSELDRERRRHGFAGNLAHAMLYHVLTAFRGEHNLNTAAGEARETMDRQLDLMVSEHNMLRYLTWCIPSIGFIGTVLGIGDALLRANKLADLSADSSAALQSVIAKLGVAFDTTLVALLASILLMLAFHWLQRKEESVVLRVHDALRDGVIFALRRQPRALSIALEEDDAGLRRVECELLRFDQAGAESTLLVSLRRELEPEARDLGGEPRKIRLDTLTDAGYIDFLENYFEAARPSVERCTALLGWLQKRNSTAVEQRARYYRYVLDSLRARRTVLSREGWEESQKSDRSRRLLRVPRFRWWVAAGVLGVLLVAALTILALS